MTESGMYRRMDMLGRITLPMELRRSLRISEGDELGIAVEEDKIILHKAQHKCIFCNSEEELSEFQGKRLCKDCLSKLKRK